jgi:hypothetical protein
VSIKCGEPDKIKLEAEVPQPSPSACPLMAKTTGRVAALAYEPLPIAVSVFDASGQKFDNISTFDIRYHNRAQNVTGRFAITFHETANLNKCDIWLAVTDLII